MFRRDKNSYFVADRPRVEVIPMIDIMMFLLVFFVVLSINMIAGTGLDMNLPGSKTTQDIKESTITVGVKKDNQFIVDGEKISGESLTSKLLELKKNRKVSVIIAGDKDVQLETLINVMDSVRGAGINSVGIAAIAADQ
ncbi:MAG: biopolymer transporter ExbD [Proteobacteria bacterium]|nr:biopolymer transporter ExbD [Pseudomonadota bacterium]MDA1331258.1 biopolymer transporter ExbD [Pseudomonadota bacterium]